MQLADLVVPGIHAVAWIAFVAGISWFITFSIIVKDDFKQKDISLNYRAICFLCLLVYVVLSLIVNIGVILSDTG